MKRFLLVIISIFACITSSADACEQGSSLAIDDFFQKLAMIELRINVANNNIANSQSTRTLQGGYYKPQIIHKCSEGVCHITDSVDPPVVMYDPNHPDADDKGYVALPNIDIVEQTTSLIRLQRAKEFLMEEMPVTKSFFFSKKIQKYLKKYPVLQANYNFQDIIYN